MRPHSANIIFVEKPEPSFLRKLRNEFGDGSNHHRSRPNPRPAKSKYAEDEDNGPTYVDEDSNEVISKEKYLEMVAGPKGDTEENEATKPAADEGAETESRTSKSKQNMAEIGASKKRKQEKVIGGGDVPEDQETSQAQPEAPKRKKNTKKKIKLSFDDEE
ncbi:hypothetical protein TRV_00844 [Trichophyton verrucosum HKI 0517]|uniref:DUF4604 domain-containing protein n=1 Tax=Trichophyton verrucosum (strain HKI 0517) TaxID=663202 RepID=D4D196_TRIVH|nr:uncharacterized protein TRV_00844 [Trichophyton verrucosum HKI 0517]EFE44371.1 hypothetical protein TRV_00844 [Trichophyton verrucosum HKI 0517]